MGNDLPDDAAADIEVSVVICTLDEHAAIGAVLRDVGARLAHLRHEIVVVDDSRDDRTAAVVRAFAGDGRSVRLLRRQGGSGLASAAIAGWDAARGRLLAIMDGDGQHDPALVTRMVEACAREQADVVVASRYLESRASGLGGLRHAMSRAAVMLTHGLLGVRLADPMSGCFLMTRQWYRHVRPRLSGVGFKILVDVVASGTRRPRTAQIATVLGERRGGRSKMSVRVALELVMLLLEKRSGGLVPARMAMFFAVGLTGLAVHLAVVAALVYAGWPFWAGQAAAILTAMTWNFLLNNSLTFGDRKLHGRRMLRGLLLFYLACLGGSFINEGVALGLHALGLHWSLAALAGGGVAALWNYHASKRTAWSAQVNRAEAVAVEEWPQPSARTEEKAA